MYDSAGEITTTGRALDREAAAAHALEVSVWDGALAGAARVRVALLDLNDHAPAFTQRFYDVRAPAPATQVLTLCLFTPPDGNLL